MKPKEQILKFIQKAYENCHSKFMRHPLLRLSQQENQTSHTSQTKNGFIRLKRTWSGVAP